MVLAWVRPARLLARAAALLVGLVPCIANAEVTAAVVPLRETSGSTMYVSVEIDGLGIRDYLVDTGAGYTTIDEGSLDVLRRNQDAVFVKRLEGTLADGSTMIVPVYRLAQLNIGGVCVIDGVEVAVFPGSVRGILGLNVLRRTAPFTLSIEPPSLSLAGCSGQSSP